MPGRVHAGCLTATTALLSTCDRFSVSVLTWAALQVVLVSRYWTLLFIIFVLLSYWLVFPFEVRASLYTEFLLQGYVL